MSASRQVFASYINSMQEARAYTVHDNDMHAVIVILKVLVTACMPKRCSVYRTAQGKERKGEWSSLDE